MTFSPEITLGSFTIVISIIAAIIVLIRRVDRYHFVAMQQITDHEAKVGRELADYRRVSEVRLGVIESRVGDLWVRFIARHEEPE